MKAMLLSDFALLRKALWQQVLLCLLIATALCIGIASPYSTIPAVAFTGGFMIALNLIALDELNGWDKYRLTFPLSRKQVVLGRYLSVFVLILGFSMVGIIIFFLIVCTIPVLDGFVALDPRLLADVQNISWQAFGATVVLPLVFLLFLLAIFLPLGMRSGLTKALRLGPIVVFWIVVLAIVGLRSLFPTLPPFVDDFIVWVISPEGTLILSLITLTLAAVFYTVSYFVAAQFYRNREF